MLFVFLFLLAAKISGHDKLNWWMVSSPLIIFGIGFSAAILLA